MKALIGIIAALFITAHQVEHAKAQVTYDLMIDSLVGIPDTIANGQTVQFFVQISLNSPLIYQGNIFLELEYGGNFYPVDTTISQNFLSPNFPNTIQAQHRFSTDDDLNIGDNVVVVWPRIGDGVEPPQTVSWPFTTTITLSEPNSISTPVNARKFSSFIRPNPATTSLIELDMIEDERAQHIRIYDITGALLLESNTERILNLNGLPNGIYFVDVLTIDGNVFTDKLVISR